MLPNHLFIINRPKCILFHILSKKKWSKKQILSSVTAKTRAICVSTKKDKINVSTAISIALKDIAFSNDLVLVS